MNFPEMMVKPENKAEELKPSIRLEFFRHDDKEAATTSGPRIGDKEVRLSQKGREHATLVGKERNPQPEVGLAFGSSRKRTRETGLRGLLANEDIKPEDSLEDIEAKIGAKLDPSVADKSGVDDRLNFDWDTGSQKFHDVGYDHFLNKKDSLHWLLAESDQIALSEKDKNCTSYSRAAGNIAELVQKYVALLPRWEEIVKEDAARPEAEKKDYAKFHNELQRFMGTHACVSENFLMKVLEKTGGRAAAEGFIDSRSNKNSFNPNEGFSVNISSSFGRPALELDYDGHSWLMTPEIIEEIIADKAALDKEIGE